MTDALLLVLIVGVLVLALGVDVRPAETGEANDAG